MLRRNGARILSLRGSRGIALLALLLAASVPSAFGQWQIASADGSSSIKLGILFQGRAEWLMDKAKGEGEGDETSWTSQNLYVRRMRLLAGGKVNDRLSFFMETDAPNYGKGGAEAKEYADLFLQDAYVTWTAHEAVLFDAGLFLTPATYNHLQGATSLLAVDYGPYTFLESTPLMAKTGRDTGAQARGLVAGKHLEYRLAVLQGVRRGKADDPFRVAGRLTFSPFEAPSAFFYPGTNLGKKRSLSFGVGADAQRDYRALHGDVYLDYPVGEGRCLTAQADYSLHDGGDFVAIPKQSTYLGEFGFSFLGNRLAAVGQIAGKRFDDDADGLDEDRYEAGLVWWADGHKLNLKLGYALMQKEDSPDRSSVTLQCQAFTF